MSDLADTGYELQSTAPVALTSGSDTDTNKLTKKDTKNFKVLKIFFLKTI